MPLEKKKLFLLDADFVQRGSKPCVRLVFKDERGRTTRAFDSSFEPYFYVVPTREATMRNKIEEARRRAEEIQAATRSAVVKAKQIEEVERFIHGKKEKMLRIVCEHPSHVSALREAFAPLGTVFEADIPFVRRYLYDKALTPSAWVEVEVNENLEAKNIRNAPAAEQHVEPKLRLLAFDIEVRNPRGVTDAKRDECTMISYAELVDSRIEAAVISRDKNFSASFVKRCAGEREMLEAFDSVIHERSPDLLCTYNGDVFDIPFLTERARQTKARLFFGRVKKEAKTKRFGLRSVTIIPGRVHFDVFAAVDFLNTIGAIRLPRLTLERAYEGVLGKSKPEFKKVDMWKKWDNGETRELDEMAEYCKSDSIACLELAIHFLPLELALSRVSGVPFFDSSRATTGQLVEALLVREAFQRKEIVPNKPSAGEAALRAANPIKGAFVAQPEAGVYENIAVLDFRSLYPSIIISHNVDPATLNCDCCNEEEAFVSPQGHKFCVKRRGLIPETLNRVIDERIALKKKMKTLARDSKEFAEFDARQWALKVIANSFYGYLGYGRSRWYSRECAESVTAWGRQYIHETIEKAEKAGFKVLYADTDSLMLIHPKGGEEKVREFQKSVNGALPEKMELELEDFYPRGIFVAKKQEAEKGAKKKYALINREGKIKIKGFELVRRDWSRVARNTQREVLRILLAEGDVRKAVEVVRGVIAKLRAGEVPLEECVMYTQLQ
ncbi:MAG: DNA-directed DNA polymerase, partial [Candidatus Norongarragalinales archaeon]